MKKILILIIGISVIILCGMWLIFRDSSDISPDIVAINDSVATALQSDDHSEVMELLTQTLNQEYERMESARRNRDTRLIISLCIMVVTIATIATYGLVYINRTILKPFQRLQGFAKNVASGNLEIPLEMDRSGSFGAFTESFDIMREELKKARENERAADRSKKELVASLSHDIKTPVASIKATVELMQVTAESDKEITQLNQIDLKAEQINTLITDMFHATLHELDELSVAPVEIHSTVLPDIIKSADYKNRLAPFKIPDCIIIADPVRLQQIFDNIIGNSYKYADTEMYITSFIDNQYLVVEIVDFGSGVPEDELPLLAQKFYRGKNAIDKGGYGLGLYISSYMISKMSGEMAYKNSDTDAGFIVTLRLRLA